MFEYQKYLRGYIQTTLGIVLFGDCRFERMCVLQVELEYFVSFVSFHIMFGNKSSKPHMAFAQFNPLPTNDAYMRHDRAPIRIYMGGFNTRR